MFFVTYTNGEREFVQACADDTAQDAAARVALPGRKIICVEDAIGLRVRSRRWGAGQPRIAGVITSVSRGLAVVHQRNGIERRRSISNLRPA
jgi:hypothetical protein